jgi:hypothetical protein
MWLWDVVGISLMAPWCCRCTHQLFASVATALGLCNREIRDAAVWGKECKVIDFALVLARIYIFQVLQKTTLLYSWFYGAKYW